MAAIALPAYQDYISKSQTTRVVGELAAAKTGVDAALFDGKTPVLGAANSGSTVSPIGLGTGTETTTVNSKQARSNLISKIALEKFERKNGIQQAEGSIVATLGNKVNAQIAGATITQKRDVNGVWTCEVAKGSAPGWKSKFVPTGCAEGAAQSGGGQSGGGQSGGGQSGGTGGN